MPTTLREQPTDAAHIWLQPLDGSWSGSETARLPAAEIERAQAISHPRVRSQFLAGRRLARFALSQYADVVPEDWLFETTEDGRPEIAAPALDPRLRFNLSHTDGFAVCLITETVDCGVDIEHVARPVDALGIARHSFTKHEQEVLEQLTPAERTGHFFELWTLKEAFLKALGSGIRLRLDAITLDLAGDGEIRHRISHPQNHSDDEWLFALYRPSAQHILAAAVRTAIDSPMRFRLWQFDDRGGVSALELPSFASSTRLSA